MHVDIRLPDAFEYESYRRANPDLAGLGDAQLAAHYATFGEAEGRRANALATRDDFAALIPQDADALEIGPYFRPMLRGPGVRYFDVRTRAEMLERAAAEGFDASDAPEIDYVSATGDLGVVDATFAYVLSSHAIEHQPDLIRHLQRVERLLRPGGRYFVLAPDHRYCFDHFMAPSTIPRIVDAYASERRGHVLESVLDHSVLTTHNDCVRHWAGDHGDNTENFAARFREGLDTYEDANGTYVDVHAWYFTPSSARFVFTTLHDLGYTGLSLERLYPTRRHTFEFWFVLRKPDR